MFIEGADNGFIVRVKSHGRNTFQEPYEKSLLVCRDLSELESHLREIFDCIDVGPFDEAGA